MLSMLARTGVSHLGWLEQSILLEVLEEVLLSYGGATVAKVQTMDERHYQEFDLPTLSISIDWLVL